jgi:hypothetical protein
MTSPTDVRIRKIENGYLLSWSEPVDRRFPDDVQAYREYYAVSLADMVTYLEVILG